MHSICNDGIEMIGVEGTEATSTDVASTEVTRTHVAYASSAPTKKAGALGRRP